MRDARLGPDRSDAPRVRALAAGFTGLAAATFALIVLGALVRAHGAGLACPDWPLCFGEVIPRLDFRVAFEFAHRVLAGSIALAFTALGVAALRVRTVRAAVGGWLAAGAALLAVQVLLGALTVWLGLAPWTVIAHLVTGNAFAVTLVLVVLRLRRAAAPVRPGPFLAPGVRPLVTLAACAVVAQVVLGGLVSSTYAGLACPGFPSCDGDAWFPSLEGPVGAHLAHRTGAYAVLAILAVTARVVRRPASLARAVGMALGLACVQAGVGVTSVLLRLPVELTGLHTALAAALVATLGVALHEAWTTSVRRTAGLEAEVQSADVRSAAAPRA
jgi:cytochrome c oxidase assembly protein subunit 15